MLRQRKWQDESSLQSSEVFSIYELCFINFELSHMIILFLPAFFFSSPIHAIADIMNRWVTGIMTQPRLEIRSQAVQNDPAPH